MKKIGIWGGSFNPPTLAHRALADFLVERAGLDQLLWLVCPHNPLKDIKTLAPFTDRFHMVGDVIADAPYMVADDTEHVLGVSQTLNSLRHLRATRFPSEALFFIMGADCWNSFHLWGDDYADILKQASLIILPRPNYSIDDCPASHAFATQRCADVTALEPLGTWCFLSDSPSIEGSATAVREALAKGIETPFLAPITREYIDRNGLYRG